MSTTYVSGPYTSGRLLRDVRAVEDAVTQQFVERGPTTDAVEQRSMADRLFDVSQGRNTVMFDDVGNPSVMVRFPAYTLDHIGMGDYRTLHPAFVVQGQALPEFWIGKYQASRGGDGRAVSLRGRDPWVSINLPNSMTACEDKGDGWHMMTNAEFAAVALWCRRNGYFPRGNNQYGRDYRRDDERGDATYIADNRVGRVAGGTGPAAWSHDGSPFGIWDLNGNVYEWVGGMQLADGEIQIIADNDAAAGVDQTESSPLWRAVLQDGSLVEPGEAGTLKYNTDPSIHLSLTSDLEGSTMNRAFDSVDAPGLSVPDVLVLHGLMPPGSIGTSGGNRIYMRTKGVRAPRRGGDWTNTSVAGVFMLYLISTRSHTGTISGFRPAWIEL